MRYEPIKRTLGNYISGSVFLRRVFYFLLDLLLLRSWHIRKALKKIRRELPPEATVLDAGSGMGQYSWRMSMMNRKWKIEGTDINNAEAEECRKFFTKAGLSDRVAFSTADLAEYRNPGKFDLILSVDVMEHIANDEAVFSNFFDSMKKNGILLVSTPSDKGGSGIHHEDDESFIDEHVRNGYSTEEISEKLAKSGFRGIEASYTYGRAGTVSWNLSMKYPVRMVNKSYLFFIILPFYYIVTFPFSVILNIIDVSFRNRTGTGLLITARKIQ